MSDKNWTVIMHFGRGQVTIIKDLTKAEAQEHMRIAVFVNQDCVNAQVFRTDSL
jgi:hypothetical protein